MKNAINIGIVVVLLLLLFTRPVALSEIMHHGELKAVCLCLVVLATVRDTRIGVLAAIVFIVLTENTHEGLVEGKDKDKDKDEDKDEDKAEDKDKDKDKDKTEDEDEPKGFLAKLGNDVGKQLISK